MTKKNTSKKNEALKNSAKPIWEAIHPNVRQAMMSANVTGVHGIVTGCTLERVEITFTHNNDADVCNHKFWFDFGQVEIKPAF